MQDATSIVRIFRDQLFTEIFPGREWVFKTLIFAKGEAETGEHPVDVRPDERANHGWPALGFRAERDARAKKHAHAEKWRTGKHECRERRTRRSGLRRNYE